MVASDFIFLLGALGSLLWVLFEQISRQRDPRKSPTHRTYFIALAIGLLIGSIKEEYLPSQPLLTLPLLGYVVTDLLNSLFVILTKKRL